MRWSRLVVMAVGFGLGLMQASVALAHAVMLSAAPTPNGFYLPDDPPTRVQLTFSEEVAPAFSAIRVFDQVGERVDLGDTQAVNPEKTSLAVSLEPLQLGIYTVAWEVLSAVDGHPSRGSFTFGVGVEATAPAQTASALSASSPASLGARWLTLTGQVLLLGLFVFRFFVWRPALDPNADEDVQLDLRMAREAIRIGWVGLGLVGLGLLLTLIAQQGTVAASMDAGLIANFRAWLGTRFGGMWAIRFWLAVALAFGLTDLMLGMREGGRKELSSWVWWAGLILSAALGLTATFTSHSAALQEGRRWAIVGDGAHLLAAGVWVGGLAQLFVSTRLTRALPPEARARHNLSLALNFSTVAAIAVGALLVSGVYLAGQHVGSWAALLRTTYGLTLLAKTGLALPAFAIASVNLIVIKPRLAAVNVSDRNPTRLHQRFNRLVLAEAGLALAVAAAAGFLTDFQRGRDALLLSEQERAVLVQSADDLQVTLTIEPSRWARESDFDVYLLGADGKPVLNARAVSLRFTFLDRSLGTNKVTAEPMGDGRYRVRGNYLSLGGTWEVEVAIRRPNAFDTFAAFQLATDTDGVIRSVGVASTLAERLTGWLTQAGGWLTGGVLILFAFGWVIPAVQAAHGKVNLTLGLLLLPSLIAMWVGVHQIVGAMSGEPVAPSGDPRALALLAESDAAMNRLTSVQLLRTTQGDSESSAVLTETVTFQVPNLFHDRLSNGTENMAQGATYYYRRQGETLWQAVKYNEPFIFPDFDLAQQAIAVRLGKIEEVNGRRAQVVTFTIYILRNPVVFARWIDLETKQVLREYMDAPGHHMLSVYHSYNVPVAITIPAPSEIGPTPTVTIP